MLDRDERFAKLLREFTVRGEIDFVFLENLFVDECLQKVVDVVAAEVRVAIGREDLIDVAFGGGNEFENGNVERAAAEIVYRYAAALLFVQPIGERRGGWFIDQAENFEAGDFAGVFRGLALGVVKIGGDSDNGAVDGFAKKASAQLFSSRRMKAEISGGVNTLSPRIARMTFLLVRSEERRVGKECRSRW